MLLISNILFGGFSGLFYALWAWEKELRETGQVQYLKHCVLFKSIAGMIVILFSIISFFVIPIIRA